MNTQQLKELLGQDKLEQVFEALLNHSGIKEDKELHNTVLMQHNRFHQYEQQERNGTMPAEELNLLRNRIVSALLSVMDDLPPERSGKYTPGILPLPFQKTRSWLLPGLAILLVLILVAGYWVANQSKGEKTGEDPVGTYTNGSQAPSGIIPVSFPEGDKVTFIFSTGIENAYQLLHGELQDAGGGVKVLSLMVRCSSKKGNGVNFWDDTFRLELDEPGVMLSPVSGLNEIVENNSSRDEEIRFVIKNPFSKMTLFVANPFDGEDMRKLKLEVKD